MLFKVYKFSFYEYRMMKILQIMVNCNETKRFLLNKYDTMMIVFKKTLISWILSFNLHKSCENRRVLFSIVEHIYKRHGHGHLRQSFSNIK